MMVLRPNITVPDSIPGIKAAVENEEPQQQLPSFSDSEFEVVSMPFAAAGLVGNPVSTRQAGQIIGSRRFHAFQLTWFFNQLLSLLLRLVRTVVGQGLE